MSTELDDPKEPTVETYKALIYAFKFFNQALFDNELPSVVFTYHRQNRVMGYASFERWIDHEGCFVDELAINPEYFAQYPLIEICQTLVHEMAHVWQTKFGKPSRRNYHNNEWANKMKSIGLMPSDTGRPGGKKTGESMMDYILVDGKFIKACRLLHKQGFHIPLKDRFPIYRSDHPMLAFDLDDNAYTLSNAFTIKKALNHNMASLKTDAGVLQNANTNKQLEAMTLKNIDAHIHNAFSAPNTTRPISKSGRIKYTCPSCRMNVWGKPGLSISCGTCDHLPLRECE